MSYKHINIEEREKIQEMLWREVSIREIAAELGRSPSSVSRELWRNYPPEQKRYTPRLANERALLKRKCRGRTERLKSDRIRSYVVRQLKERWSPEQIAGRLRLDLHEQISHEAIYQFIYAPIHYGKPRPGYEDLRPYLRRRRKRRVPKGARRCQKIFKPQGVSIDRRPKIVNERRRIGDWEGDSVESVEHRPGINTALERKSGLVLISKLRDKSGLATAEALAQRFQNIPRKLRRTLTLDNGPENRDWELIETKTGFKCFYAHPYHSWERGANENVNGLIRDYFPKKTDFTTISEAEIARVELALNSRPRKRLGWRTPLEVWSVALQS